MSESVPIMWRRMLFESELGSSARLVALALSTHMDRDGGSCFPSLTLQQRETRLARSTVCTALDEIERARLVMRTRGGRGRPTRYRPTSPLTGLPLVRSPNQVVRSPDSTSPLTGPEDVQEDVHNFSTRARARGKRKSARRTRAKSTDPWEGIEAYDA